MCANQSWEVDKGTTLIEKPRYDQSDLEGIDHLVCKQLRTQKISPCG